MWLAAGDDYLRTHQKIKAAMREALPSSVPKKSMHSGRAGLGNTQEDAGGAQEDMPPAVSQGW